MYFLGKNHIKVDDIYRGGQLHFVRKQYTIRKRNVELVQPTNIAYHITLYRVHLGTGRNRIYI